MSNDKRKGRARKKRQQQARKALESFLARLRNACKTIDGIEQWLEHTKLLEAILREYEDALPFDAQARLRAAMKVADATREALEKACNVLQLEVENVIALLALPVAAAPPAIAGIILLTGVLILAGALLLLPVVLGGARLLFTAQMALFTVGVCFTPTIANSVTRRRGRLARIIVETTLFMALLGVFSLWFFGTAGGFGVWLVYALGLTLVLETGSHLIERHIVVTVNRVARTVSFWNLLGDAESVQKMFRGELVLYVSVPIGLMAGTVAGLLENWTIQATIVFCVELVLSLASVVMLVFLIIAFARMSNPLFKESQGVSEPSRESKGILGKLGRVLRFLVPPPQANNEDQETQDLSVAYMITDLRKIYLYDSVHNVILLIAFASIIAGLLGIAADVKWVIIGFLGFGLVFGQLPYIIGQSLLHEKVLDRYEGVKRADMAEKLKKNAPLFPTLDFFAALFATGTGGGFVYFLLDQFVKNTLK